LRIANTVVVLQIIMIIFTYRYFGVICLIVI